MPAPAAGAVQVPEADVTVDLLGCVMPPTHELIARAAVKGAAKVPTLGEVKLV